MHPRDQPVFVASDYGGNDPGALWSRRDVETVGKGPFYEVARHIGIFMVANVGPRDNARIGRYPYFAPASVHPLAMATAAAWPRLDTPSLLKTADT